MGPTMWRRVDEGQQVRLSEDYFISTSKANPADASRSISRLGITGRVRSKRVTVGVKAGADLWVERM